MSSLSDLLTPASSRGVELKATLGRLFAAFNAFTGDEMKTRLQQVAIWAEELGDVPLYAIRKAYSWVVRSREKLPSLAEFIRDVQQAQGDNVARRLVLMRRLLAG